MTDHDRLDELLAHSLRAELEVLADDGFSAKVVGRVRQRKSLRVLAISLASITGLLIGLAPAGRLLEKLEAGLTRLLGDLETSQSTGGIGKLLETLRVRETLTGLSEQIMSVFTLTGDSAWLVENQVAITSTLLALAVTATLRLLVN